ncbi:alpha/beta fold hydrolase [Natronospira bacteriovora]|uniref:Alpha/beta fold hydrolase n=1 Tax=Natronospira bacteriovora TaxID=3069753 RepID=A0ABU0W7M4_9GAMM|nr:alpha/beta fold hydrolase [Natronospira sp. AB-CW4]MDQ2070027.1 alpha/beta fold hydrolase [Natronospira sp. AB-CW4]
MIDSISESHFVTLPDGDSQIHLRRLPNEGTVVLMLHGAIENGRIFYSQSARGLAPWLAQQGYDVWVMDLGGRGESLPAIADHPRRRQAYSQTASIVEEIPAVLDYLQQQRPGARQHWVAHSWGGVMLNAVLARFPDYARRLTALCYFGSKRRVRVWNWQRLLYVDLIWCWLCPLISRIHGYLPARRLRFGSDDESLLSHRQSSRWVRRRRWIDEEDGFDYGQALSQLSLPPTLYLAGAGDRALGHPDDVQRLMEESGQGEKTLHLLSKANGHARDYGHIDMLTARDAAEDHFPLVLDWFARHESPE